MVMIVYEMVLGEHEWIYRIFLFLNSTFAYKYLFVINSCYKQDYHAYNMNSGKGDK